MVTSISVLADIIGQVGGDHTEVVSLIPPGADVHTFQATPQDAILVSKADIVFFNGLELEVPIEDMVGNALSPAVPLVVLADSVEPNSIIVGDKEGDGNRNPHLWLNPQFVIRYVETIRDAFIELDPSEKEDYRANAEKYLQELAELDGEIEEAINSIPQERRKLITLHDAFSYLAQRYGLEVIDFALRSPGRVPSAKEVADLVENIRATGVGVVYKEPQFNAEILEMVASDTGVEVLILYNDALGDGVSSYLELMRYNKEQLVEGLR